MATKKIDINELERQCLEAEEHSKLLRKQFETAKKEEEEKKKAKLAAERETRYDEVMDAYNKFEELRSKFVDDYGRFTFETKCECKDEDICDWIFRSVGLI